MVVFKKNTHLRLCDYNGSIMTELIDWIVM